MSHKVIFWFLGILIVILVFLNIRQYFSLDSKESLLKQQINANKKQIKRLEGKILFYEDSILVLSKNIQLSDSLYIKSKDSFIVYKDKFFYKNIDLELQQNQQNYEDKINDYNSASFDKKFIIFSNFFK